MNEYTVAVVVATVCVTLLDRGLQTHLLRRPTFWIFMGVMMVFKTLANGYLTWRPIVLYGAQFCLGIRIFTIPVEDYLYGFSLITLSVVLWEHFTTRWRGREAS